MKRIRSLMLILLIAVSLVFPLMTSKVSANPGRDIWVYVVKASDSSSSWVASVDEVERGVTAAVNDATAKTEVVLSGENIHTHTITSIYELWQYTLNPPQHAVFINTHGEVVPVPDTYCQNDAGSGGDAGDSFQSATLAAEGSHTGYLADQDMYDWYQIYVPIGKLISVSMTPPSGSNFDLELYDPSNTFRTGSYAGGSATDSIEFYKADKEGYWRISIYIDSGLGDYTFELYVTTQGGGGGYCPYVSTWNGSAYVLDNNLMPRSEISGGADVTDYYLVERALAQRENGLYGLLLSEFESEHDFFDQVQLLAVDHQSNVSVAVSSEGQILTYTNPQSPVSAMTNERKNVKHLLSNTDESYYQGCNGSYVDLNFGDELDISRGARLVLRSDMKCAEVCVKVQVQEVKGNWSTVAVFTPRQSWATDVIDMSEHLPDTEGNLKVRLYFTANHKIDFVGLDTSPQAEIEVKQANLVSATHSKTLEDVKTKLSSADQQYAKLLPGQRIELQFALPANVKDARNFILVCQGHYSTLTSSPMAPSTGPDPPVPKWRDWFDLIAKNCRENGWIWANVAGYPFYYVSNTNKFADLIPAGGDGLKRYMSKEVVCRTDCDGHQAKLGAIDDRPAFYRVYGLNLFGDVSGWRPLANSDDLLRDTTLYVDKTPPADRVTTAIVMNHTTAGVFIHSGLGPDEDDYTKGYIAAALAIEEARAYITGPVFKQGQYGGYPYLGTFTVSMIPGAYGWVELPSPYGYRKYVDLLFTLNSYYEENWWTYVDPYGGIHICCWYSNIEDFEVTRAGNDALFDTEEAGVETTTAQRQLMNKIGWWGVGQAATAFLLMASQILETPLPFAGVIGLIPIYLSTVTPPDSNTVLGEHNWINGIAVDSNGDDWCSSTIRCKIYFPTWAGQQPTDYSFNCKLVSWISYSYDGITAIYRLQDLTYTDTLTFTIKW